MASEFRAAGGLSVTLTGGGEPTLHPQLAEFGRIAEVNGLAWGLYTNGHRLSRQSIDSLLQHSPEFIRVSVNSWSPQSHHRLYRLGLDAYAQVGHNLVELLARRGQGSRPTVGLGYVMGQATPEQMRGIASFVESTGRTLHGRGRPLDYVAVRPALVHYDRTGAPVKRQPRREGFGPVPDLCRRFLGPACEAGGVALFINDHGFKAVAAGEPPSRCLSTPWVTSSTETGRLFLLSEATGSPQPGLTQLCYGDASGPATFREVWNGPVRRALAAEFTRGDRLAPVWHKTSGLEDTLRALRADIGILPWEVAERVTTALAAKWPKPPHWMFL
jgi:hypothetical protein